MTSLKKLKQYIMTLKKTVSICVSDFLSAEENN